MKEDHPSWPEITNKLVPGQHSEDRLDLITRVFQIKLLQLLDDFKKKQILGKVTVGKFVK